MMLSSASIEPMPGTLAPVESINIAFDATGNRKMRNKNRVMLNLQDFRWDESCVRFLPMSWDRKRDEVKKTKKKVIC